MFGSKSAKAHSTIDCLIGSGTVIEGDLRFRGGLRIDGEVIGRVLAEPGKPSLLVLSHNARVKGEIRAAHVVIDGTVEGPVQADELLELQPRARVSGDIRYAVVEIQHGAIVDGAIVHLDGQRPDKPGAEKPGLKLASRSGGGEPAA
jgi:cytoskeletal protein CcmA (bactofilin family)